MSELDTQWMSDAKCKNGTKTTAEFFEKFERSTGAVKIAMVRFCESCPVMEDCYRHANLAGETGLWGGTYFLNGKPKNPLKARYLESQRDMAASKKAS